MLHLQQATVAVRAPLCSASRSASRARPSPRCLATPRASKEEEPEPSKERSVFDKLKDIIPRDEEGKDDGKGGRSLTPGSLIELIGFGLGAPVPSEIRFDRENLRVQMDFEANNFEKNGKYRDEGWVEEEDPDAPKQPGFWENLFKKREE